MDALSDTVPDHVTTRTCCGTCKFWDRGECLWMKRHPLPMWLEPKVWWTTATQGAGCQTFDPKVAT